MNEFCKMATGVIFLLIVTALLLLLFGNGQKIGDGKVETFNLIESPTTGKILTEKNYKIKEDIFIFYCTKEDGRIAEFTFVKESGEFKLFKAENREPYIEIVYGKYRSFFSDSTFERIDTYRVYI